MEANVVFTDSLNSEAEQFVRLRSRVLGLLQDRNALSWHSLQYYLCETGTPSDRVDPRSICPALMIRGTPVSPLRQTTVRPWDAINGLYVSPVISDDKVESAVEIATRQIREMALLLDNEDQPLVATKLNEYLLKRNSVLQTYPSRNFSLCEGVEVSSTETIVDLSPLSGMPVLASVTNDLEWLYPDDPRIWRHLLRCREMRAFPVFIARKISIATFPLLKQLSAFGIQLHLVYLSEDNLEEGQRIRDQLLYPLVAGANSLATHAGLNMLRTVSESAVRSLSLQIGYDRARAAEEQGLAEGSGAQPGILRSWAQKNKVEMPNKWINTVREWELWQEKGLLRLLSNG